MDWRGESTTSKGVTERGFNVAASGRSVPGVLWTPSESADGRLVMLGHGGMADKRAPYILALARWLARDHGVSAFAIDGPGHGERLADGAKVDFDAAWADPATSDDVVEDWYAALDAVRSEVGNGPLGYWGLSMGTMMGVPVVAAPQGQAVDAALLGLMGLWGANSDRLRADAPRIGCPVRFLLQWDDEIVPRQTALDLFNAIGSSDKALRAHPGRHQDVPPAQMRSSAKFLATGLAAAAR